LTSSRSSYRLGVDIGGTFTDLALYSEQDGELFVLKTPSTSADPSEGAATGIDLIVQQAGIAVSDVDEVVHATTHGANIVIEGKGAKTALLTTEGFGDILVIQRQLRYSPYDLRLERHLPLVPRELVFEVSERLFPDGTARRPLDEDQVTTLVESIAEKDVESIAVCLLHSYANGAHERRVAEIVRSRLPGVAISLSSEVSPYIREYERASTTVADAYIRPAFEQYLRRLEQRLDTRGFRGRLLMLTANGGVASIELVLRAPIQAVESGPAGAVAMACSISRDLGVGDAVAFDMGGTTAKAGIIRAGRAGIVDSFEVDKKLLRAGTGLPLRIPSVDIIEVGAGGGSIARSSLGVVEVGPESAGAEPGPACYRGGGRRATVTDANLVLGYLNPTYFNDGAFELGESEAQAAVTTDVATPLHLELEEAAWGVHEAVSANMEHAIRTVSTDRGDDPRALTLVASGGAAPLHACRIARNLGMRRVLIPAFAGVISALGLLDADARIDLGTSFLATLSDDLRPELESRLSALEDRARRVFRDERLGSAEVSFDWLLDAQYQGQGHSVGIDYRESRGSIEDLRRSFHARYSELYGSTASDAPIQVTGVRVIAVSPRRGIAFPRHSGADHARTHAERPAYFPESGGFVSTPVYRRESLRPGMSIAGHALVEDATTTVVVLPGDTITVDERLHLIAAIEETANA
jgi:N-methylhydantoinase A/oxoprolinase/acetone carboxylase beta subunit